MSSWLRITLTWLLALALPLQGNAAQAMLLCGPNHAGPMVRSVMDHRGDHVTESSAGTLADDDDARTSLASQAGDGPAAGHATQGKCSACASCCSVCALTSALLVFEALPMPALYAPERETPRLRNLPTGLERPPRSLFA